MPMNSRTARLIEQVARGGKAVSLIAGYLSESGVVPVGSASFTTGNVGVLSGLTPDTADTGPAKGGKKLYPGAAGATRDDLSKNGILSAVSDADIAAAVANAATEDNFQAEDLKRAVNSTLRRVLEADEKEEVEEDDELVPGLEDEDDEDELLPESDEEEDFDYLNHEEEVEEDGELVPDLEDEEDELLPESDEEEVEEDDELVPDPDLEDDEMTEDEEDPLDPDKKMSIPAIADIEEEDEDDLEQILGKDEEDPQAPPKFESKRRRGARTESRKPKNRRRGVREGLSNLSTGKNPNNKEYSVNTPVTVKGLGEGVITDTNPGSGGYVYTVELKAGGRRVVACFPLPIRGEGGRAEGEVGRGAGSRARRTAPLSCPFPLKGRGSNAGRSR